MRTSALYEEELAVIDWRKMLPEGGTPGQRLKLMKSLKELLEAMIEYPVTKGRSGLAHSTVLLWCNQLRYLVAWMASEGLWSFSQLGTQHLLMFLKTRRQRHGPGRASATTVHGYVRLYYRMWELRTRYSDSLRVNPGLIEPDVQLLRCTDDRPFKAIPEEVALPLIKDAIEWLTRFGPLMTQVVGELWQVRIANVTLPQKARQPRIQALYKVAQWESLLSDLESALQMKTARPNNILCRAMTVTLGAAVVVLLFMVGMRVRELVRLDVDCLQVERKQAGVPVAYLSGIAAKAGGRQRRWVAGDPIPEVIEWLRATFAPCRTASGSQALFLARSSTALIPPPGTSAHRMGVTAPIRLMQAFADSPFRADRPATSRLHPHAARKTFAKFVVKRDKRALEALSVHYGHAYREFTDGVYVGADFQLSQLLEQEDRDDLARTLTSLMQSSRMGGKAAERINEFRRQYQKDPSFAGKAVPQTLVDNLVRRGIKIAPCDWGYCVYSESHSACRGDAIGPNEVLRAPDVCSTCANFVVTTEHQAWWNDRVIREETFLTQRGLPEQTQILVTDVCTK
ncbi:tyrosine-type recombinase/integrase [Cupriavidus pinatubonensis]|uniref:tyrosine-type recombinase/integrase n=1 Tax=Cupriavidus pinatubonensis TaxID=248026 RepID=UPI00361DECB5